MALIEVYHVVADILPVDPAFATDVPRGALVRLNALGEAGLCPAGTVPYGIAGDTQSNDHAQTSYSSSLIIGADGAYTRQTQNRVSDYFNETAASGLITVYHSGGVFRTDNYVAGLTLEPNSLLYAATGGQFTTVAGGAAIPCGQVTASPSDYPSGVPGASINGADAVDGSISLGTFLTVKLLV